VQPLKIRKNPPNEAHTPLKVRSQASTRPALFEPGWRPNQSPQVR
jgi:hypothetical protein